MLENFNYNLEREYKFYEKIPLGQRSKRGAAVAIKKDKRLNIRTTLQTGSCGSLLGREKKKDNILNISTPKDQATKDSRDLLEQLPAPMILLEDFNARNPLWGSKKMSKRGRYV